ncbi:MAG: serine/threonine-protein kinase [Kofleriaceae bacterium]
MATEHDVEATATSGASGAVPPPATLRPGAQLGRYLIERVLGAGGMGLVYAAHDPDLDRRVAIKVLRGDAHDESRVRLLREARAMAKLSHPNVITVYEVGTSGGVDFVAMELLEGGSLAEWLRAERRPAAEVLRRFRLAGAGLAAAHARGLVHRDFKPANVLLGRDGAVVVTDFGLARGFDGAGALDATLPAPAAPSPAPAAAPAVVALDETMAATPLSASRPRTADLSSTLTRTGAVLGTPAYMAPEQFAGGAVGPAADQFAFAVALWEGLTGTRPYRGATVDELHRAVAAGPPDAAVVPRAQRAAIVRALAPTPEQRWPDMGRLLTALDAGQPGRRVGRWAVVAGVALVAGGTLLVVRARSAPAPAPPPACPLTEEELDDVWTPAAAAAVDARLGEAPRWDALRTRFAGYAAAWRTQRAASCAVVEPALRARQVACLAGLADSLAAAITALDRAPLDKLADGVADALADPATCSDGWRAATPALPVDAGVRTALATLRRDAIAVRLTADAVDPGAARAAAQAISARAERLAEVYPPARLVGLDTVADVARALGECSRAVPLYEQTATVAETVGDDGARAVARLRILECEVRAGDLPRLRNQVEQARVAITRAGDDATLGAALHLVESHLAAVAGDTERALAEVRAARATYAARGDSRRVMIAYEVEFQLLAVAHGADLAPARALAETALAYGEAHLGEGDPQTETARLRFGLMVSDVDADRGRALVATATARLPTTPFPAGTPTVRGRVIGPDGAPRAGVTVEAALNLATADDSVPVTGHERQQVRTITDAGGEFALAAPPGVLVAARVDDLRSQPARLATTGTVLALAPAARLTVEISPALAPAAAADVGQLAIQVVTVTYVRAGQTLMAIGRRLDPTHYQFSAVPAGPAVVSLTAVSTIGSYLFQSTAVALAPGQDAHLKLASDLTGATVDVIVRPDRGAIPLAQVAVYQEGLRVLPRGSRDVSTQLLTRPRVSFGGATVVDAATGTPPGAALYQPGDLHARMVGVKPGRATVCVLPLGGRLSDPDFVERLTSADLEVQCQLVTVSREPVQAVVVAAPPMKNLTP